MSSSIILGNLVPVAAGGAIIVVVLSLVLWRAARREKVRQRASWRRYFIRTKVLRDLAHVLWGAPRLQDLRERRDDRP